VLKELPKSVEFTICVGISTSHGNPEAREIADYLEIGKRHGVQRRASSRGRPPAVPGRSQERPLPEGVHRGSARTRNRQDVSGDFFPNGGIQAGAAAPD